MASTARLSLPIRWSGSGLLLQRCRRPRLSKGRQVDAQIGESARQSSGREVRHRLRDGKELEVLSEVPSGNAVKPPLLFVHGSDHSAWCWREHFQPYFCRHGYPSHALSVRGQGKSDDQDLKISGTLESHTADLLDFVGSLNAKPVLVTHSFMCNVQQYMAVHGHWRQFSGMVALCPAPPSGNGPMIQRFFRRDVCNATKTTWYLLRRSFKNDPEAARHLFFSDDLPHEALSKYHAQLAACSPALIIDVRQLNKVVPFPSPQEVPLPVFVLGAENDNLVDREAVEETAAFFGVEPVMIDDMAHDAMLDTRWEQAAEALLTWLDASF